jgi:uncharacterized protein YbjT (DUF2867 family)
MRTLIIGGTGLVGGFVARALAALGVDVRVTSRSVERLAKLPDGIEGMIADLNRPETLRDAFAHVDRLFLVTAHSITETGQGMAAIHAAARANVERIVYMSAAAPPGATRLPHIASKAPVESAIASARIPYTILRPTELFQNDLAHAYEITFGLYPQPIGDLGVSRIDARDVADAAVHALTREGHTGRMYTLGGADALTGDDVAATYTHVLGRKVDYAGDDIERWTATAGAAMPRWQRNDVRIMFRYMQEHGLRVGARELYEQHRLIGREPRPFAQFVEESARDWAAAPELTCSR